MAKEIEISYDTFAKALADFSSTQTLQRYLHYTKQDDEDIAAWQAGIRSPFDWVDGAFTGGGTPEGAKYWLTLAKNIEKMMEGQPSFEAFITFLKEHKDSSISKRFVENCENVRDYREMEEFISSRQSAQSWLYTGFTWSETKDTKEFWSKLYDELKDVSVPVLHEALTPA